MRYIFTIYDVDMISDFRFLDNVKMISLFQFDILIFIIDQSEN